jgi:hypothetical protein
LLGDRQFGAERTERRFNRYVRDANVWHSIAQRRIARDLDSAKEG